MNAKTGVHFFVIKDDEVVATIWAEVREDAPNVAVQIERDDYIPMALVIELVDGLGDSLRRYVDNDKDITVLYDDSEDGGEKRGAAHLN